MKVCRFNFNNEVDSFTIHVEDDGRVSVPGADGQILAEYDNVKQLAEIYAQARDVKPENLKNWELLVNGDVYSFVLRAGTAGVNVGEVEEQLENAFASLADRYHALSIARAKEQVMSDGSVDLTEALVHCTETDIARDIYDTLNTVINGADAAEGQTEVAEVEETDTRSDLEKYIDVVAEVGTLALIAMFAGVPADGSKEDVLAALAGNFAFSNVDTLRAAYNNAISEAKSEGIGVITDADAVTVITQTAVGVKDDAMKNRMIATARLAGRSEVNVSVDVVGETHIRHTAEIISLDELEGKNLLVRDNVPYVVRFDAAVDAELEAEREATNDQADAVRLTYDEDEYEDEYEDGEGDE